MRQRPMIVDQWSIHEIDDEREVVFKVKYGLSIFIGLHNRYAPSGYF